MRVLIYTRVSTRDRQDHNNQLIKLRAYCKLHDYKVYKVVTDKESGSKSNRSGFQQLFTEAEQKRYDILLFWSLDRFTREGARKTIFYLQRLEDAGVGFKSLTEQYIDSSGIFKDVIITLLATLAKQERIRISERTLAGLEKARFQGRIGGRPPISKDKVRLIKKLYKQGLSKRAVAREVQVDKETVKKYLDMK